MKSPLVLLLCAAAALAACTTEPRVTVNTTPAYVATAPAQVVVPAQVVTPAPVIASAPVISTSPTVVLGAAPAPLAFDAIDRDFAFKAAAANMLEIGAARIAPRRTGSADVLAYAAMLDSHHTLALNELSAIMRARGVQPPTSLPHDKQGVMDRVGMSRGFDFDRAFIDEVGIRAHTDAILAMQRDLPALTDPDLRSWAERTLPVMRQHLDEAHRIAAAIG
jgi:putative membrane protein